MNKFIALFAPHVGDVSLLQSQKAAQSVLGVLRRESARKVVPVMPHVVLFDFDGDKAAAYHLLAPAIEEGYQLIVMEIAGSFAASGLKDTLDDLEKFFAK